MLGVGSQKCEEYEIDVVAMLRLEAAHQSIDQLIVAHNICASQITNLERRERLPPGALNQLNDSKSGSVADLNEELFCVQIF